jgi:SAM-dependent methyltransferase
MAGRIDEDVALNRASWDEASADYQRRHAAQLPTDAPTWGVWGLPEDELHLLGEVRGLDVLELGCGGAQWSIALARRGARATGLDASPAQLAHARRLVASAGVPVRLVEASAHATGLPTAAFDLVFADHGAPSFTDPHHLVPEVARLLRPGGRFVFNAATPWLHACVEGDGPPGERLVGDYFGLGRVLDEADRMVEWALPYGAWIRLFRASGLEVLDLAELRPPEGATTTYEGYATVPWARRFPAEQVWTVRRLP